MQRKMKYIILVMLLISAMIFKVMVHPKYATHTEELNVYLNENKVSYDENSKGVSIKGENETTLLICPDSRYEAEAYIPLAKELVKATGYNVQIMKYDFLGNMNVWLGNDNEADIILAHGDGSEYIGHVSKNYQAIILLGSTPYSKIKNDHVMVIRGELDHVSDYNNEAVPGNTINYQIEKANFSNYVYADMHKDDVPALISQDEQIMEAIECINDFVVSIGG